MRIIKSTLTGIGQIFLQENGLTGFIITFAMFFSHWTLGVSCFLGALIGTLTAYALRYPMEKIQQGLYGFNASLAFMCVMFTFGEVNAATPTIWLLGFGASIFATLIMHQFIQRNIVAFTFPFVLTCWLFCWSVAKFKLFGLAQTTPPLADYTQTLNAIQEPFYAWAEVNFGSSLITGVLLFFAIALNSPIAAMWGVAAASIGTMFATQCFNIDQNSLANGIYGFSPILVACAFAGTKLRHFLYVIFGTLMAVSIQYAIVKAGFASYTIGFILASWTLLGINMRVEKWHFNKDKLLKVLNP